MQDAAEAEIRHEHEFQEREADQDRQFDEDEGRRETEANDKLRSTLVQLPAPPDVPGAPVPAPEVGAPLPGVLEVSERAESVIVSLRCAPAESAARHADDIRDVVQSEREEMARQLQLERQLLAERQRADEECKASIRELEEELARVRVELRENQTFRGSFERLTDSE